MSVTSANAAWLPPRTIDFSFAVPDARTVFFRLDARIVGIEGCPGENNNGIDTIGIRTTLTSTTAPTVPTNTTITSRQTESRQFDVIYSSLLRAQAAQSTIRINDNLTFGNPSCSGRIMFQPYLRFDG